MGSVPTVKIVNHRAKDGYVIINLSDFIIGVHSLWDPKKKRDKIVVKTEPVKTNLEPAKEAEIRTDVLHIVAAPVETQSPSLESKSSSASPSPSPDIFAVEDIPEDVPEDIPEEKPQTRRGRKPGKTKRWP